MTQKFQHYCGEIKHEDRERQNAAVAALAGATAEQFKREY